MSDPRFCLYCLCWQLSGALHEQPGVRCGRDILAGAGFGARSRLVDVYIYQLVLYSHDRPHVLWDMYYWYRSVPFMYWLCIICFRTALSHMYISCYLSVHVYPDYYILSLRCEIVPLVLCDSISIVQFILILFSLCFNFFYPHGSFLVVFWISRIITR